MSRVVSLLMGLLAALPLLAQPDVEWTVCFGGNQREEVAAVKITPDHGFVACGWASSEPSQAYTAWINSIGQLQFFGQFLDSAGGRPEFHDIAVGNDGFFFAGGKDVDFPGEDGWLIKTDLAFNTIWEQRYGGEGRDLFNAVTALQDGGCIAAGVTESFGSRDVWIVRADNEGNLVWERHFGADSLDEALDLAPAANGDVLITGTSHHPANQYGHMLVARMTAAGDTVWTRRINEHEMTQGAAIREQADGNILVAGCSDCGTNWSGMFLVCIQSDGTELQRQTLTNLPESKAFDFVELSDHGFMLMGCQECNNPASELALLRVNAALDYQESRTYGTYRGSSIALADDGGYAIAASHETPEGPIESCVLRTAADALDAEPHPSALIPSSLTLSAYPNPFNPTTTISFSLPVAGHVTLTLFDITGREVRTLADGMMSVGNHSATLDGRDFPAGVYLARLQTASAFRAQKLLLIK